MKENLKVTKLRDGTPISNSNETQIQDPVKMGAYFIDIEEPRAWVYKDDPKNNVKYGKLYNWYAVKTGKLCPQGWHIPSIAEWEELKKTLGWKDASRMMRTADWKGAESIGNNQSGFTALPAGYATSGGIYFYGGERTYFWTSSPGISDDHNPAISGAAFTLYTNDANCPKSGSIFAINRNKINGISCRCIADNPNSVANVQSAKTTSLPTTIDCEAKAAIGKYKASMIQGERLSEKEKLVSINGRYQLRVTTDGNIVIEEIQNNNNCQFKEIYRFPLTPGGSRPGTSFFSFNPDGNVCMDTKQGKTFCATTGRDGKATAILTGGLKLLELTNTGKLRLVNDKGQQVWAAN